jgi:hypothetical protein
MSTKNLLVSGFTLMIVSFILIITLSMNNKSEAKYTIHSTSGQIYYTNNFKIIGGKNKKWEFTTFEDSRGNIVILNSDVDIIRKKTDAE